MSRLTKRRKAMLSERTGHSPLRMVDAVTMLRRFDTAKFDQTVEVAVRLGIDPKQASQIVRGSIVLPHGIGKSQRVVVFAKGDHVKQAAAAGADVVGQEDLADRIKAGWLDFDVCIATPDMMKIVGPLGKILGPRGLMPSPRAGTVTPEVTKTVKEYKAGKVEFRNDSGGNIHAVVGKMSFDVAKLVENIQNFLDRILSLKPDTIKGTYLRSAHISATMSPSVRLAL